jgi:hypothetical protein
MDSCPPPLAHALSMISPVKIVSFAIAKPGTSNAPAAILISSFFILFSLGLINVWELSSLLAARSASLRIG